MSAPCVYYSEDPRMEVQVVPDHDYCVPPVTSAMAGDEVTNKDEALRREKQELKKQIETLQLQLRFGLHHLLGSDEDIQFYTRFASYKHFQAFWQLVEPVVQTQMVQVSSKEPTQRRATKLPPVDELLLFLMHLSLGLPPRDLANRFNIHLTTVGGIIAAWTHFLYRLLGSVRLWLPPEEVKAHLPPEFSSFPDTQVVLHCTEIKCQTPSSVDSDTEDFSAHTSHRTFKAVVGFAPHGPITFVSALFDGSVSDREIFRLSDISRLLTADVAIMVHEGFPNVDALVPCKVHRPAFLSQNIRMHGKNVQQRPYVSRLGLYIDSCIQRVTENELFDRVIPSSVCGNISQLFSVACFLVNFQCGPLLKTWTGSG